MREHARARGRGEVSLRANDGCQTGTTSTSLAIDRHESCATVLGRAGGSLALPSSCIRSMGAPSSADRSSPSSPESGCGLRSEWATRIQVLRRSGANCTAETTDGRTSEPRSRSGLCLCPEGGFMERGAGRRVQAFAVSQRANASDSQPRSRTSRSQYSAAFMLQMTSATCSSVRSSRSSPVLAGRRRRRACWPLGGRRSRATARAVRVGHRRIAQRQEDRCHPLLYAAIASA